MLKRMILSYLVVQSIILMFGCIMKKKKSNIIKIDLKFIYFNII